MRAKVVNFAMPIFRAAWHGIIGNHSINRAWSSVFRIFRLK